MKRILLLLFLGSASLVLLAAVGLGLFLGTFNPNDHKQEICAAVEKATGRQLVFLDGIETTLFPWLGLKTGRLRLNDPAIFGSAPFASIESASLKIALEPLLNNVVRVDEMTLHGAVIKLATTTGGQHNWEYGFGSRDGKNAQAHVDDTDVTPLAGPGQGQTGLPAPGGEADAGAAASGKKNRFALEMRLVRGSDLQVVYRDMRRAVSYKLAIDDFALRDLHRNADIALELKGKILDENLGQKVDIELKTLARIDERGNITARIAPFSARLAGSPDDPLTFAAEATAEYAVTPGTIDIRDWQGTLDAARYTGRFTFFPAKQLAPARLEGELNVDTLDLPALIAKIQTALPASSSFAARSAVSSPGASAPGSASSVAGAPNLTRPTVKDPKRTAPEPPEKPQPSGDAAAAFQKDPEVFPAEGGIAASAGLDTDVALTAKALSLGRATLSNVRARVLSAGAQTTIPLSFGIFGGSANGTVRIDKRTNPPALNLVLALANIRTAEATEALAGKRRLTGLLTGSANVGGRGESWEAVIPTLKGQASFVVSQGEVHDFGLIPPGLPGISKSAPSSFVVERISASARINKGMIISDDASLLSKHLTGRGGGTINLVHGQLDLGMDFMVDGQPPAIPVNIRGPYNSLSYGVDTRVLLRNTASGLIHSPEKAEELIRGAEGLFRR